MGVYNGLEELGATIKSVLDQRDVNLEFIIVDDGSNEHTRAALERFKSIDSRIKLFHQPNRGLTQALIRGCQEANGRYIARQDVGDISCPSRLVQQKRSLDNDPDAVLVSCGVEHYGPEGEFLFISQQTYWHDQQNSGPDQTVEAQVEAQSPVHGCVMFKRKAYHRAGGYRSEFYYAQDQDLWARLSAHGTFKQLPALLYKMYWRDHNISAHQTHRQRELLQLIQRAYQPATEELSDRELLALASKIRPRQQSECGDNGTTNVALEHWYFIGSQLLERKDRAARTYLLRVVRHRPWHIKAWLKYISSLFLN